MKRREDGTTAHNTTRLCVCTEKENGEEQRCVCVEECLRRGVSGDRLDTERRTCQCGKTKKHVFCICSTNQKKSRLDEELGE